MPPRDSSDHAAGQERRPAALHPDVAEAAQARTLLATIERRMAPTHGSATSARDAVARTVRGLFGDD